MLDIFTVVNNKFLNCNTSIILEVLGRINQNFAWPFGPLNYIKVIQLFNPFLK